MRKMQALANEISRAISLCNSCPKQAECLEEGMRPENLAYGIWGGRLAGERLIMADEQGIKYMTESTGRNKASATVAEPHGVRVQEKRNALNFLRRIKPWIRW